MKHVTIPSLLLRNAESLNFEKIVELEITVNYLASDLICLTEVQSQNLDNLKIAYFNELVKLRLHDHYLGKRVVG